MEKVFDTGWRWLYVTAITVALFTGFGNMPLWGRYYIADIPGLKWSGQFYVNLQVHLFIGAVLVGLIFYSLIHYLAVRQGGVRLTRSGITRAVFLILTILSGIVLAVRNLSAVQLPFEVQAGLVFFHMGTAIVFMIVSLVCIFTRCRWTKDA